MENAKNKKEVEPSEDDLKKIEEKAEDEVCPTCGGTGEVSAMEQVYPGEPHMADIGTQPCPDCRSPKDEDDYDDQE